MKLKNRLKYWRHQKQMNQTEFAEWLGINKYQYNRYERQAAQPTLEIAWRIAEKLGIKIDDLFERVE